MNGILRLNTHRVAFIATGVLCAVTLVTSGMLILKHLQAARDSKHACTCTIRILFMVPIYSSQAWLALILRLEGFNKVLELLRKGYECIVIIAFAQLLVGQLGGIRRLCQNLPEERCCHLPPVRWVVYRLSWTPPERFIRRTLGGLLQYVPVSLFAATFGAFTWLSSTLFFYTEPCCNVVICISQAIAMYCLIVFYHSNQVALAPLRPVMKLVFIKVMIFFTIWQGIALHAANRLGAFYALKQLYNRHGHTWTENQLCEALLNIMLVIEMFMLSLIHHIVYPPRETSQRAGGSPGLALDGLQDNGRSRFVSLDEVIVQTQPQTDSAMPRFSQPVLQRSLSRERCPTCRRFVEVWDLRDIKELYDDLRYTARTRSSDNLVGPQSHWGGRCSYICNFFRGTRSPSDAGTRTVSIAAA